MARQGKEFEIMCDCYLCGVYEPSMYAVLAVGAIGFWYLLYAAFFYGGGQLGGSRRKPAGNSLGTGRAALGCSALNQKAGSDEARS